MHVGHEAAAGLLICAQFRNCLLHCRRVLDKVVTGSRWIPGVGNLTEFAFNMIEGMQGLYSYVEC